MNIVILAALLSTASLTLAANPSAPNNNNNNNNNNLTAERISAKIDELSVISPQHYSALDDSV